MAGGGLRGAMGIVSLILIAGALVLMFFVVLSGLKTTIPLSKTYFLSADTSSITGARAVSQWTYFYVCGSGNTDCGNAVPGLPIGYAWIGGGSGAPSSLLGNHGHHTTSTYYYYMWRFGWVLYLISLVFTVFAFFTSLLAPCFRLAAAFSGLVLTISLFFFSFAAALMTTVFVKARNVLQSNGHDAHIGKYAFGFTWGAWAAIFLASIFLFLGCGASNRKDDKVRNTRSSGGSNSLTFWKRQRRSNRGSFVDNESQRRVKDEYA